MSVDISKPSLSLRAPFLAMLDDYDAHDPENGEVYAAARLDFGAYVRSLLDEERGVDLPVGYVPCSHRWLLDAAGTVVGITRVRHNIDTPFLAEEGGHIGYDVPPSHRGHRYGIACLGAALAEARRLGLERVLLCCDADNPASRRTIEACGGVFEREYQSQHFQCLVRRYWIDPREAEVVGALA